MFYDKKIKYLDYYERGERIKGCGFAKIEARDEELRIELTVSGLHPTDSFAREVMLCSDRQEKQLTQLEMYQGRGELKRIYHSRSDIGGTGIPYWELCGICIHLGGDREISCRWQKSENKPAEMFLRKAADQSLHAAAIPAAVPMPGQGGSPGTTAEDSPVKLIWPGREDRQLRQEREGGQEKQLRQEREGTQDRQLSQEREGAQERQLRQEWEGARRGEKQETIWEEAAERGGRERQTGSQRTSRGEPVRQEEARRERERLESAWRESAAGDAENSAARRREPAEREYMERKAAEREPIGRKAAGRETIERQPAEREFIVREPVNRESSAGKPAREERRHPRMLDDKWMQLCAIYPHVQPFRDERDYLSIKPADFLLFPTEAYRQVNNSFLLHGYYNYKHLLLSRMERKGEIIYYIGVPGNYYEKEKQVALMFGFESFECAEEPAEDGDFGYYMMRMEL